MGVDAGALAVAIVSLLWGAFVWWSSRRDAAAARGAADRALAASESSAASARESAAAADRLATAAEQSVDRAPWALIRVDDPKNHRFDLMNKTGAVATNVTATGSGPGLRLYRHPQGARIDPGAIWSFVVSMLPQSPQRTFRVEWTNEETGEPGAWECVL